MIGKPWAMHRNHTLVIVRWDRYSSGVVVRRDTYGLMGISAWAAVACWGIQPFRQLTSPRTCKLYLEDSPFNLSLFACPYRGDLSILSSGTMYTILLYTNLMNAGRGTRTGFASGHGKVDSVIILLTPRNVSSNSPRFSKSSFNYFLF